MARGDSVDGHGYPCRGGYHRHVAKKPRNPIARSPLLRKGGAHKKSKSGERMKSRDELRKEVDESASETDKDPRKRD